MLTDPYDHAACRLTDAIQDFEQLTHRLINAMKLWSDKRDELKATEIANGVSLLADDDARGCLIEVRNAVESYLE